LPRRAWAKVYLNPKLYLSQEASRSDLLMNPLSFAMDHAAFALRQKPEGMQFNGLASLNKDLLSLASSGQDRLRFSYELTNQLSEEEAAIYMGGKNLSDEWQNTLKTLANMNPAYGILLESLLRAQVAQLFGDEVSLRDDLYPLFEGEYALSVGSEKKIPTYLLILSHQDEEFVGIKLEKLMKGFAFLSSRLAPKLEIVTLPDGTESRELVAGGATGEETEEDYQGYGVHCLQTTEDAPGGFCYTVGPDWLALSNSRNQLLKTIDLQTSPESSLAQSPLFRGSVKQLSKVTDEITYVQPNKLMEILEKYPKMALAKPYLSHFSAATWVKRMFDDGVSVEGFVLTK
jgi:hypothetical protein